MLSKPNKYIPNLQLPNTIYITSVQISLGNLFIPKPVVDKDGMQAVID